METMDLGVPKDSIIVMGVAEWSERLERKRSRFPGVFDLMGQGQRVGGKGKGLTENGNDTMNAGQGAGGVKGGGQTGIVVAGVWRLYCACWEIT